MPEINVKDTKNQNKGKLTLDDTLFGIEGKTALMHASVVNHLANQRQGTHATKTKGLVSGGGRKPWKQKGTGRARSGSSRSPLWRGGGTIFGPTPRDYSYSMPRKARKHAFYAALSAKIKDGEVVVVDGLSFSKPRTKDMVEVINTLGISGGSIILVLNEMDANVALSARNIPAMQTKLARDLNAYDVLSHKSVLITKDALESLQQPASGEGK